MSDLISRSKLIEEIKSLSIVLNGKQIFSDNAKDTVLRIINEQPTAYSVDKVVEEFDKIYNNSLWIKGNEEFSITRNELIEIVKQGGIEKVVE